MGIDGVRMLARLRRMCTMGWYQALYHRLDEVHFRSFVERTFSPQNKNKTYCPAAINLQLRVVSLKIVDSARPEDPRDDFCICSFSLRSSDNMKFTADWKNAKQLNLSTKLFANDFSTCLHHSRRSPVSWQQYPAHPHPPSTSQKPFSIHLVYEIPMSAKLFRAESL